MAAHPIRRRVEELLARADVRVNGSRPWDIEVHDPGFYRRVLAQGSMGLGESYMDGWWDCRELDEFIHRILAARLDRAAGNWRDVWLALKARLFNLQTRHRAWRIGKAHYDVGDDLFERMLDRRMIYSCGYWRQAHDLNTAQEAKLALIADKLGLEPGMRVLDIGCGWGGTARFFAERYGAHVTGVTVSKHQAEYGRRVCEGLPIDIRLQDYRDIDERFDRIVSIGMFEHVGYRNYERYMDVVRRCLTPNGLSLLHTIGRNESGTHTDPWTAKYIFPNSMLPSIAQIGDATEERLVMEDWHNFGADYDTTLMAWHENIESVRDWVLENYGERFLRMWRYFLLMSAGGFRARQLQLWQVVLSPDGVKGGYGPAPR